MSWFVGIDGGGSKTSCLVGDAECVAGRATGPSSKVTRVGEQAARAALKQVLAESIQEAGITAAEIARVCIGTSGASVPEVVRVLRETVAEVTPAAVHIVGDQEIAHFAAFRGAPGVLVIAGTGSIAYGRTADGRHARAGGWGSVVSDEGSGEWIGKCAVASVLRAHDDEIRTALTDVVLRAWKIQSIEELVVRVNSEHPPFAELFPQVEEIGEAGDPVAHDVLTRAGTELAALACRVARRLWPRAKSVAMATAGGVFANSALVQQSFAVSVKAKLPKAEIAHNSAEPVTGALEMARRSGTATGARP